MNEKTEKKILLAVETTGKHPSVALMELPGRCIRNASYDGGAGAVMNEAIATKSGKIIAYKEAEGELNHTELLVPLIDEILKENGVSKHELYAIAVSAGPGSFTGIRVGVSTVRALCQGLGIPGIAVPTLESFVYNEPEFEGIVVPVFDAKRSEVYAAAYKPPLQYEVFPRSGQGEVPPKGAEGLNSRLVPEAAYKLQDFLEKLAEAAPVGTELRFYGDGALAYRSQIEEFFAGGTASPERGGGPRSGGGTASPAIRSIPAKRVRGGAPEGGGGVVLSFNTTSFQSAKSIAILAAKMLSDSEAEECDKCAESGSPQEILLPYDKILPIYLRRSEAEIKLEQGLLGTRQKKVQARFRRNGRKISEEQEKS